MITIHKYDVPEEDYFELELPVGAQILTVQDQFGKPYIWILKDTEQILEMRYFKLIGTGHNFKSSLRKIKQYIGTFQLVGGALVLHLFEMYGKGEI